MKNLFRRTVLFVCLFNAAASSLAAYPSQQFGDYVYDTPRPLDFARYILPDQKEFFKFIWRKEAILPISLIVLSTGLLIWKDQYVVDQSQKLGDQWHLSHDHDQTGRHGFKLGSQRLDIGLPDNWGQALYFIGDGWFHFGIAGGMLGFGLVNKNNRALQTSSQMAESILASGLVVQVLKHVTGRESPYTAEISGGRWRFFPNQIDYHKNVAKHDAYPSGHLAAATASVTVLASNYPEHRWIAPFGGTLLTLLTFQMMNNGVHWAGDYPLAIGLGYSFGRIAVRRGRKKADDTKQPTVSLAPQLGPNGGGLCLRYRF